MNQNNGNNETNNERGNFGVPDGYFRDSASRTLHRIEWEEEHRSFPNLFKQKGKTGFITPETYFDKKDTQLELLEYPLLKARHGDLLFLTPLNYFEEKEIALTELLMDVQLEELSGHEFLKKQARHSPFTVSEEYFHDSENKIRNVLVTETRVISLFSKTTRYTAAAAVLVITLGLWLYNAFFSSVRPNDCESLACIDRYELIKNKNLENIDNEDLYELVDSKALEKNLNQSSSHSSDKPADTLNGISVDDLPDEL